jgi:hypothetical protein
LLDALLPLFDYLERKSRLIEEIELAFLPTEAPDDRVATYGAILAHDRLLSRFIKAIKTAFLIMDADSREATLGFPRPPNS